MSHACTSSRKSSNPASIPSYLSSEYITSKDLSAMLHVCDETVSRMRFRKNGPPYIRISRCKILYRLSDVEAWLSSQLTQPGI